MFSYAGITETEKTVWPWRQAQKKQTQKEITAINKEGASLRHFIGMLTFLSALASPKRNADARKSQGARTLKTGSTELSFKN